MRQMEDFMEKKELNIVVIITLAFVIVVLLAVVGGGMIYITRVQAQLTEIQEELRHVGITRRFHSGPMPGSWSSADPAASDSVEGKLRAQGKHWLKTPGDITVGSYVQDTLEGRTGQPQGRGAIGKVVALGSDGNGAQGASVDFGRGYVAGIHLSELSLVTVEDR